MVVVAKYLLLTEFEVRTVSYEPSFSPSIYGQIEGETLQRKQT